MKIAIIGTGAVGAALNQLLTSAGHNVAMGSRSPNGEKMTYEQACSGRELVVLAVPFAAVEDILPNLSQLTAGSIVVDVTNPVNDDWSPFLLGEEDSGAERISRLLPDARVVKAFNTIFADNMSASGFDRDGSKATAFIAADDDDAGATVASLAADVGLDPVRTGPLATSRFLEAMAHLNISIAIGQAEGTSAAFIYHRA